MSARSLSRLGRFQLKNSRKATKGLQTAKAVSSLTLSGLEGEIGIQCLAGFHGLRLEFPPRIGASFAATERMAGTATELPNCL